MCGDKVTDVGDYDGDIVHNGVADTDVGDYDGDVVHQVDGDEKLDPVRLAFLPLHAFYTLYSAPTLQSCIWYNVAVDLEGVSANICDI